MIKVYWLELCSLMTWGFNLNKKDNFNKIEDEIEFRYIIVYILEKQKLPHKI